MEGEIKGRKQRGTPRLAFLEGMALGAECDVKEILRRVGNRKGCKL